MQRREIQQHTHMDATQIRWGLDANLLARRKAYLPAWHLLIVRALQNIVQLLVLLLCVLSIIPSGGEEDAANLLKLEERGWRWTWYKSMSQMRRHDNAYCYRLRDGARHCRQLLDHRSWPAMLIIIISEPNTVIVVVRFNQVSSKGYVWAYVCFLQGDLSLTLITADNNDFQNLQEVFSFLPLPSSGKM